MASKTMAVVLVSVVGGAVAGFAAGRLGGERESETTASGHGDERVAALEARLARLESATPPRLAAQPPSPRPVAPESSRRADPTAESAAEASAAKAPPERRAPAAAETTRAAAPASTAGSRTAPARADAAPATPMEEMRRRSQAWVAAIHSLEGGSVKADALAAVMTALAGNDRNDALPALWTLSQLDPKTIDVDAARTSVLRWFATDDAEVRRSAEFALARFTSERDLETWIAAAERADRNDAELVAGGLTRAAGGVIEGRVADSVLHLLRDGTDIKKAFVIRGLQLTTQFEPRVLDRLVEIVRSVEPHDYDSGYFFHFLAERIDPKSEDVLNLVLDVAGRDGVQLETVLRALRRGVSADQRPRVATRLLDLAEGGRSGYARQQLVEAAVPFVGRGDLARLDALAANPNADDGTRAAAKKAADAARKQ